MAWYIIGLVLVWDTIVSIDGSYTSSELIMNLVMGVFGPLAIIWWLVYALPEKLGKKPIKWLSRGN